MENNNERTDRFFRERLMGLELTPEDQIWGRISSRLRLAQRRKAALFLFRIAAGMTLLVSLGLGYYLLEHTRNQSAQAVIRPGEIRKPEITSAIKPGNVSSPALATQMHEGKKSSQSQPLPLPSTSPIAKEAFTESTTIALLAEPFENVTGIAQAQHQTEFLSPITAKGTHAFPVPIPDLTSRPRPKINLQASTAAAYPDDFAEEPEKPDRHPWSMGSEIAPLYSYRTVQSDNLSSSVMNTINKSEAGMIAYAGGLSVAYSTGRRLSVESGVYYSRYGQQKSNVESYTASYSSANTEVAKSNYLAIPNSTGTIVPNDRSKSNYDMVSTNSTSALDKFTSYGGYPGINSTYYSPAVTTGLSATQYFDYLEVPLTVKYKILNRQLGFSVLGGLVTNFLVNNGITLHQDGSNDEYGKTTGISHVNYLGSVGLGVEYPILNKVAFSLEPRFRYYLNPIDKSSQINVHPYSFGVFAGFRYTFK